MILLVLPPLLTADCAADSAGTFLAVARWHGRLAVRWRPSACNPCITLQHNTPQRELQNSFVLLLGVLYYLLTLHAIILNPCEMCAPNGVTCARRRVRTSCSRSLLQCCCKIDSSHIRQEATHSCLVTLGTE